MAWNEAPKIWRGRLHWPCLHSWYFVLTFICDSRISYSQCDQVLTTGIPSLEIVQTWSSHLLLDPQVTSAMFGRHNLLLTGNSISCLMMRMNLHTLLFLPRLTMWLTEEPTIMTIKVTIDFFQLLYFDILTVIYFFYYRDWCPQHEGSIWRVLHSCIWQPCVIYGSWK